MMFARFALAAASLFPLILTAADSGALAPAVTEPIARLDLTSLRAKADGGDANAQYQLGLAYAQGLQTPKDPVEAFAWLTLAAESGAGGRALQVLLETLPQAQVANGRRRLEALRAGNPVLRPVAATPLVPAPTPSPIIAAPARQAAASSPLIPAPATPIVTPGEFKAMQDQLATALQDKRQLSAELSAAWKEIEQLKAQLAQRPDPANTATASAATAAAATPQAQLQQAQSALSTQAGELNTARAEVARLQAQLGTLRESLATQTASAATAGDAAAALLRERKAHAATQSAGAQLKTQLNEAAASRAMLERDLMSRLSASDRAQSAAVEETRRLTALHSDSTAKADALSRELAQARADLASARQNLSQATGKATAETDRQARRVTELESSLGAARNELAQTKAALAAATATAESAASRAAAAATAESELNTLRGRITTLERDLQMAAEAAKRSTDARTDADSALRTANQRLAAATEEVAALRRQVTANRELEQRVQQLEAEKGAAVASAGSAVSRDELARATAAQAAAEDKLATALRAYTQLTRERDELRGRLADLSARHSAATETLAAAEARARTTAVANSAVTLASAELETLRNRADNAEREAEASRTEAARANQLLAGARPATSAPTRPTVTPGRPARTHTIAPGETLSGIALRYYGTAARWPEILAANRDVLPDERSFVVGRTIRIP
jgi:nucleoid-associated protein YgaU